MNATTDRNLAMSYDERSILDPERNDTGGESPRLDAMLKGAGDFATHDGPGCGSNNLGLDQHFDHDPGPRRLPRPHDISPDLHIHHIEQRSTRLGYYKVREVAAIVARPIGHDSPIRRWGEVDAIVRETDRAHCRTPGLSITPMNDLEGRSFPRRTSHPEREDGRNRGGLAAIDDSIASRPYGSGTDWRAIRTS
jgi:hypothetical protein